MVDVNKIKNLLNTYFRIDGSYKIDPDSGVVDVQGNVILLKNTNSMPVQFGHVGGDFYCNDNKLISLAGAPDNVGSDFLCHNNKLTTLEGAPRHVGGGFYCYNNKLTSLAGAPDHVDSHFVITYDEDLPLLRICTYKSFKMFDGPMEIIKILARYTGTGRPGALKAAAELIRAGYAENARW